MRHFIPFALVALLFTATAATAAPAAAPAMTTATPADTKLSPADMQTVLDVLNDPQKRAAFTATLQAMVHATHAAAPKPAARPPPSATGRS